MFQEELINLGFPYPECRLMDINNDVKFRKLIGWLETHILHKYSPENRELLNQFESLTWDDIYRQYKLISLCPIRSNNRLEEVEWFLGRAEHDHRTLPRPHQTRDERDEAGLNTWLSYFGPIPEPEPEPEVVPVVVLPENIAERGPTTAEDEMDMIPARGPSADAGPSSSHEGPSSADEQPGPSTRD